MNVGVMNHLKVLRKSNLGYMLADESNTEVLMHFNEASKELEDNEEVDVFVYYDKQGRTTATMNKPVVTLEDYGFASVVETISNTGVFVDINCGKDSLVSLDYLPYDITKWPLVGDKLAIKLKIKKNSLIAKPINKFDVIKEEKTNYAKGEKVSGYVCRVTPNGIGIFSLDFEYIFVSNKMMRDTYRLGQAVEATIINLNHYGDYNATLNEVKEILVDTDKETILAYLKRNEGKMKFTAKSSSEEVEAAFKMSRKAFKRALGNLYKEKLVTFDDDFTYLV